MRIRGPGFSVGTKILISVVAVFLLLNFSAAVVPFVRPIFLGWMSYPALVWTRVGPNRVTTGWTAVCVVALIGGSHLFVGWVYLHLTDGAWKIRWSLSIAAVTFLLLLAGMSMMGIAHQTGWLITSPVRLMERRRDWNCLSNVHQIGEALAIYSSENGGHYPPDLSTLLLNEQLTAGNFICPSSDDLPGTDTATTQQAADELSKPHHCSYIYLGKGLVEPIPATRVLLVEPPRNHEGDGMNVLFGDGHAEWVDREKAAAIFDQYHAAEDGTEQAIAAGESK